MNYDNGFIYRIDGTDASGVALTYIGSSCGKSCERRFAEHKCKYKRYKDGKGTKDYTSFPILDCEDCRITLVEKYPCASKDELRQREQYYIDTNECVNKYKAYTGVKTLQEYNNQYYEENKEKMREQMQQYYEANREKIREQNKRHYEANREKRIEQTKQYRLKNKEKVREQQHQYYLKKKLNQNQPLLTN